MPREMQHDDRHYDHADNGEGDLEAQGKRKSRRLQQTSSVACFAPWFEHGQSRDHEQHE